MKGVACSDEPTENYHSAAWFPSALRGISPIFLCVLILFGLVFSETILRKLTRSYLLSIYETKTGGEKALMLDSMK